MYVVRVNHKNGLYIELLFMELGKASDCAQTCAASKLLGNSHPPKPAPCEVLDDAGRQTWLDGAQIAAVQLVELEAEVRFNTRMRVVATLEAEDWIKKVGLADHPLVGLGQRPQQQAPAEAMNGAAPAIGAAPPTFSS